MKGEVRGQRKERGERVKRVRRSEVRMLRRVRKSAATLRCMKLQKPLLVHSPVSYWGTRQATD